MVFISLYFESHLVKIPTMTLIANGKVHAVAEAEYIESNEITTAISKGS